MFVVELLRCWCNNINIIIYHTISINILVYTILIFSYCNFLDFVTVNWVGFPFSFTLYTSLNKTFFLLFPSFCSVGIIRYFRLGMYIQNSKRTIWLITLFRFLSHSRQLTPRTGENESCFKKRIPRVTNEGERSGVNTAQWRVGLRHPLRGKWSRSRQYGALLRRSRL